MHFVQELGELLDLVNHDGIRLATGLPGKSCDLAREHAWIGGEPAELLREKQIVEGSRGEEFAEQRTFTGLSRTPEEASLGGEIVRSCDAVYQDNVQQSCTLSRGSRPTGDS
jgi:hypothetical protein